MKRQSTPAKKSASPAKQSAKRSAKKSAKPATKLAAKSTRTPRPAPPPPPDLYSSLHALLHTMRLIEQHEEPLCTMHDELRRTGRLTAPQRRRLQQLLADLPADDYQHDLETLREAAAA